MQYWEHFKVDNRSHNNCVVKYVVVNARDNNCANIANFPNVRL